jgi:hypothetical protein
LFYAFATDNYTLTLKSSFPIEIRYGVEANIEYFDKDTNQLKNKCVYYSDMVDIKTYY